MIDPSAAPDPPLGFPDPPRSWWLGFPVICAFVAAILAAKLGDGFFTWFRFWWDR